MGKPGMVKQKKDALNKTTRVCKPAGVSKCACSVRQKRLVMLQRRLSSLMNERSEWEEQNKKVLDSLKAEKSLTASLKKESFHWQRLYHETAITLNSTKVKQIEIAEMLTLCLREIDSIYPHMVGFSELVTANKIRISNMLNVLPSSGHSAVLKQFQDRQGIREEYKQSEKPTKHKVGPMVKGLQIVTKPKIMIERLMLPQVQPSDQMNVDIDVDNHLTTIPEANENEETSCIRHVTLRPKRRKLGSSWRIKKEEKLRKERDNERGRENQPVINVPYSDDSSESDGIDHLEQVLRYNNVSRLSSKLKGGAVDQGGCGSRQTAISHLPDDPLEGSSWMYTDFNRRSSLYKSDSSDEDDTDKLKVQKKSGSFTQNTLKDAQFEEPDSTNNDSEITPELLTEPVSSSTLRNSNELSTDYNNSESQLSSCKKSSVRLSKIADFTPPTRENSLSTYRHSNNCQSPRSSVSNDSGKRIRKPANRYPIEDFVVPIIDQSSDKRKSLTSQRKSLAPNGKKKSKGVKGRKKKISVSAAKTNSDSNTNGFEAEDFNVNVDDAEHKSKMSVSKKSSIQTPVNPRKSMLSLGSEERSSRPRRNKSNKVSYKESPLNIKKRRP